MLAHERWSEHTRHLPPLIVGNNVRIQDQIGHHPNKWDKTGTMIEVHQFDQHVIRLYGSQRVTLCNRKFLHKYILFTKPLLARALLDDLKLLQPTTPTTPPPATSPSCHPNNETPTHHTPLSLLPPYHHLFHNHPTRTLSLQQCSQHL